MADKLAATAHHEAGHAVAAFWLERRFRYVTIEPGKGTLGHMQSWKIGRWFQPEMNLTPRTRQLIDREVVVLYAGGVAEKRFAGRHSRYGSSSDRAAAIDLASYVSSEKRALEAYLRWRFIVAEGLIKVRWKAVERVAASLLKSNRLTFAEARNAILGDLR